MQPVIACLAPARLRVGASGANRAATAESTHDSPKRSDPARAAARATRAGGAPLAGRTEPFGALRSSCGAPRRALYAGKTGRPGGAPCVRSWAPKAPVLPEPETGDPGAEEGRRIGEPQLVREPVRLLSVGKHELRVAAVDGLAPDLLGLQRCSRPDRRNSQRAHVVQTGWTPIRSAGTRPRRPRRPPRRCRRRRDRE